MSEDGIYGSPAAREKFAREHPDYGNPHPGNGHHKKPAEKKAAAATTQVNHYSKRSCHVKDLLVFCEHHEKGIRKAAPEEEHGPRKKPKPGEKPEHEEKVLVLNVIPHGTATKRTASGLTTPGQPLTDYSQDKYYDQGHDKLERQHDALKETQQHASDARANQDHRVFGHIRADMAEGRANRQGAAYAGDKAKFMKTYGDHVHGNAELYLSQGDPRVDDAVTLKATMTSHCSKHPIWKVWDCLTNRWIPPLGKGQELEFVGPEFPVHALPPPVIPASYLQSHSILPAWVPGEKAYWLKGIEPRRYKIHVVWSGSVKIGATLFDLYGEKNFLNALPGYISEVIQKITDVGITLRAGLKAELNGKAEWTQAPESTEVKVSGAVELAGILYVTVRFDAMLRVANEDVLGGHAHGTTTFSVKGELGFEPKEGHMHMPLDITAQWEKPLELNFLFVYIFGKKSMTYSFLEGHFPPLHICQVDLMGQG